MSGHEVEIEGYLGSTVAEKKAHYRLAILVGWLSLEAWQPRVSRMLLAGLDPDASDKKGQWRVLPGTDADEEEGEILERFERIDGLRLRTASPKRLSFIISFRRAVHLVADFRAKPPTSPTITFHGFPTGYDVTFPVVSFLINCPAIAPSPHNTK
jgi:hypothetical protein